MNKFAVLTSVISPASIALFTGEKYDLSKGVVCKLLKTGINHTYKIESENHFFIFRIYSYNWRTKEEIAEELKLLNLLKQNGISISFPIADKKGELIQTIEAPEGKRFAVMFSYAHGRKIQHYNSEIHYLIGKMMAQIHNLTQNLKLQRIQYQSDILLDQSIKNIQEFLSADTEEMQFLLHTQPILEEKIVHANTAFIRSGIVHLDIWFDNFNISGDQKITLFDFDFCGNGWLCLDVAYYLMQLYNTEKNEAERAQKTASFLAGYESVQIISDEEKKLLPYLGVCLYYFYLGVQCARFNNWSNTFLNEVYLKRYITVFIKGYYDFIKNK